MSEFHQRDGWYFSRLEDGSVQIRVEDSTAANREFRTHMIPPNEWASVIASVCGAGETAATFRAAERFHVIGDSREASEEDGE